MSSRADAIELTFTPLNGARRRLRLEPRSDGVDETLRVSSAHQNASRSVDVGTHSSKRAPRGRRVAAGRAGNHLSRGSRRRRLITVDGSFERTPDLDGYDLSHD